MPITREDVLHVAKLAKLELEPREVEPLMKDLSRILEHVESLAELDTADVAPTAHVAVDAAPFREDERAAGLTNDQAVGQSSRVYDGAFAVPAFVDEG